MRHMNYLFLSFLIIILAIPNYCTAQMQSVITTSTKRVIPVQNIKPIKSLPLDDQTQILTLSHYKNGNTIASVFSLTADVTNTNNTFPSSYILNVKIEDFVVYHNSIFFCGWDSILNHSFFCITSINNLMTGNISINKFDINAFRSFSKIDYYIDANGAGKISLISSDNTFIDINLITMATTEYKCIGFNSEFVDVKHTKDFVVVLSKIDNGLFGLYTFNKNNINDFIGYSFSTPTLYTYNDSIFINTTDYRYLLEPLDVDSTNNVAVGFSSTDIYSGTEICNIDLNNSMSIVNTQAVTSNNEVRSYLYDMKYSKFHNGLICLIWNSGIDLTDNIFMIYPFDTLSYTTSVTIPEINISRHLFYYLTPYDTNYYLAVGKDTNNTIYLLDKKTLDYSDLRCVVDGIFEVELVNRVRKREPLFVIPMNRFLIFTSLISIPAMGQYFITCQ